MSTRRLNSDSNGDFTAFAKFHSRSAVAAICSTSGLLRPKARDRSRSAISDANDWIVQQQDAPILHTERAHAVEERRDEALVPSTSAGGIENFQPVNIMRQDHGSPTGAGESTPIGRPLPGRP